MFVNTSTKRTKIITIHRQSSVRNKRFKTNPAFTSFVKRMSRQSLENFVYCALEDKWEGGGKKSVEELMKELDEDE